MFALFISFVEKWLLRKRRRTLNNRQTMKPSVDYEGSPGDLNFWVQSGESDSLNHMC